MHFKYYYLSIQKIILGNLREKVNYLVSVISEFYTTNEKGKGKMEKILKDIIVGFIILI